MAAFPSLYSMKVERADVGPSASSERARQTRPMTRLSVRRGDTAA
jgi:hypothetical protein